MHFLKVFLWLCLFVIVTFFWVVAFEYGISGFSEGVRVELQGLGNLLSRG